MLWSHYRVFHSKDEFVRGKSHVNGIESFWSFTNCSDHSTYCWEKAMRNANDATSLRRIQDDASEYLKRLSRAYEKNPINLTEKQRYLIDSAGFGAPKNSALFKAVFRN